MNLDAYLAPYAKITENELKAITINSEQKMSCIFMILGLAKYSKV